MSLELLHNPGARLEEALREQMNRWVGGEWLAAAERMTNQEMDRRVVGRRMEGVGWRGFHSRAKLG